MEFKTFLKSQREKRQISQAELAERLSSFGYETSDGRIGHWETGRNKPPLNESRFRYALASALEMDVSNLLAELGYIPIDEERTPQARIAADIVDHLPENGRELAIEILRSLEKRFE